MVEERLDAHEQEAQPLGKAHVRRRPEGAVVDAGETPMDAPDDPEPHGLGAGVDARCDDRRPGERWVLHVAQMVASRSWNTCRD
jgi:hypothetical protein